MQDAELAVQTLQRLRALGVQLAIDDFGTGYSSLAYLNRLPIDTLKVDRSFVQRLEERGQDAAIVRGVIGLAKSLDLSVIAEGIETEEQAEYARALGATLGQGFLYGRPARVPVTMPTAEIPLPIFMASMPYTWRTPFELASAHRKVRRGTIDLLASISRELEGQAALRSRSSLLISSFPGVDRAMAQMEEVYTKLARDLAFAAVLGIGMPPEPTPGLKGINIHEDDPVSGTWNVVVISAHFASMLAAKERPRASGAEQEFDFVFTYDRNLIIQCAQALMLRVAHRSAIGGEGPSPYA
jgi:hypothetical protein